MDDLIRTTVEVGETYRCVKADRVLTFDAEFVRMVSGPSVLQ